MSMVFYSNPYSSKKNFGRAINDFCATVPNDAWICLQDGDIMYLTDYWGKQIEDIIAANPQYCLFGCMTNRLKAANQLYNGQFSENDSVLHHQTIAEQLYKERYEDVEPTKQIIAGMWMLFPKWLWNRVKFRENSAAFDTHFCRSVQAIGGKIGIAKGLYVFHRYRLGKENPIENNKHLFSDGKCYG